MIQYLIVVFIKVPFYCYFTGTILYTPKDIFPSTVSSEVTEFSAVNQHQLGETVGISDGVIFRTVNFNALYLAFLLLLVLNLNLYLNLIYLRNGKHLIICACVTKIWLVELIWPSPLTLKWTSPASILFDRQNEVLQRPTFPVKVTDIISRLQTKPKLLFKINQLLVSKNESIACHWTTE